MDGIAQEDKVSVCLEVVDAEGRQIEQAQVGEVVQLKIYAHDLRAIPRGVFAVYTDIDYPAGLVPLDEATLDPYFANGRSGFHDRRGLIDELGAFGGIEYPADPTRTLVATIPMRAVAAGVQPIALDAADYEDSLVLLHGWDDAVPSAQIDYVGTTVTVVERKSADAPTDAVDEVFDGWNVPQPDPQVEESRWEDLPTVPAPPVVTSTNAVAERGANLRDPLAPHSTEVGVVRELEPAVRVAARLSATDLIDEVSAPSDRTKITPPHGETPGNELTILLYNQEAPASVAAKPGGKLRWKVR